MNSRVFAIRDADKIKAKCAADAGFTRAIYEMNQKLLVKPWNDSTLPSAVNVQLENTDTTYSFSVTGDITNGYSIVATGNCGQSQRTVRASLKLTGPFDYSIFAQDFISLKNSARIDWYNNDPEDGNMKVGTNATQSGKVMLYNSAIIDGDVYVGVGGDPDVVIELKNSAVITGDTGSLSQENVLPPVTVPSAIVAIPSGGTISNNTTLNSGSYKYTTINLGNSKILTINGNVSLYITGSVTLGNSAEIKINPNSSLVMYEGGDFEGKNSASFNNLTQIPRNLQIFCLDTCTSIGLKNSSSLYGTIYAPNANLVYYNSASVYGSFVANTVDFKNSAQFNYDASLRDANPDDELVHFETNHWSED